MNQTIHPAFSIYAVHPAYFGQMDQLAQSAADQAKDFEAFSRQYKGEAFSASLMAFNPNDVHQLTERTYYSYADGIRYYLSNSGKRIAIINMQGLLYKDKYTYMQSQIQAAEHPAYHGVLIIGDSPGGQVRGMEALREAIASYTKPLGVYVSGMLASAAAYVTASANFIIANPKDDNLLGSIGIFQIEQNVADKNEKEGVVTRIFRNEGAELKYKPNALEPWTEEEIEAMQANVTQSGNRFHEVMKSTRTFSSENWDEIRKGGAYDHNTAITLGLIDGLGSLDEAYEKVASLNHQFYI